MLGPITASAEGDSAVRAVQIAAVEGGDQLQQDAVPGQAGSESGWCSDTQMETVSSSSGSTMRRTLRSPR